MSIPIVRTLDQVIRHIIRTNRKRRIRPGTYEATVTNVVVTHDNQLIIQVNVGKKVRNE